MTVWIGVVMKGVIEVKPIREYQEVMQKLYEAVMKYPDEKLAKAVGEVRDLVVEYKNIIDSYKVNIKDS